MPTPTHALFLEPVRQHNVTAIACQRFNRKQPTETELELHLPRQAPDSTAIEHSAQLLSQEMLEKAAATEARL